MKMVNALMIYEKKPNRSLDQNKLVQPSARQHANIFDQTIPWQGFYSTGTLIQVSRDMYRAFSAALFRTGKNEKQPKWPQLGFKEIIIWPYSTMLTWKGIQDILSLIKQVALM